MAEDHRRVEARQIVGTGMATDAERITQVADEAARRERAWRNVPELSFGEVLVHTPARAVGGGDNEERDERDERGRRDPRDQRADARDASASDRAPDTAEPRASTSTKAPPRPPLRPALRAPDPRARLLHAQLAARTPAPTTKQTPTMSPSSSTATSSTAGRGGRSSS
jgi:hypothetical protein